SLSPTLTGEAEQSQALVGPAVEARLGWFCHDEYAADGEQRGTALSGDGRRTEASGRHHIASAPASRSPPDLLRPQRGHGYPVRHPEADGRLLKEPGAPPVALDQEELGGRPDSRQHETRDTTSGSEVGNEPGRRLREGPGHRTCMIEVDGERTG